MALSADTYREALQTIAEVTAHPVNAGSVIYAGGYVMREAATNMAVPGDDATGVEPLGVALEGLDNTDGADGSTTGTAATRAVRVGNGIFPFAVDGGTPLAGEPAYLVDDNTVSATATTYGVVAGKFVRLHSTGVWYVDTRQRAAGGAAAVSIPAAISGGESPTEAEFLALRTAVSAIKDVLVANGL